jgi:hypothetical protein
MGTHGDDDVAEAVGAMLAELEGHPEGLTALRLTGHLEELGFPPRSAQRAVQRALDSGAVALGSNLELMAASPAQSGFRFR